MMPPERVEAKLISYLNDIHSIRKILFDNECKQYDLTKLILIQHQKLSVLLGPGVGCPRVSRDDQHRGIMMQHMMNGWR